MYSQYCTCSKETTRPLFPRNLITADLPLLFNWVLFALAFPLLLSSCHTLQSEVTSNKKSFTYLFKQNGIKATQSLVFGFFLMIISFLLPFALSLTLTQLTSLPRSLTTPPHHVTVRSSSYGYRVFPGKCDCGFDALSFHFSHYIPSPFSLFFYFSVTFSPHPQVSLFYIFSITQLPFFQSPNSSALFILLTLHISLSHSFTLTSSSLLICSVPSMAAAELLI